MQQTQTNSAPPSHAPPHLPQLLLSTIPTSTSSANSTLRQSQLKTTRPNHHHRKPIPYPATYAPLSSTPAATKAPVLMPTPSTSSSTSSKPNSQTSPHTSTSSSTKSIKTTSHPHHAILHGRLPFLPPQRPPRQIQTPTTWNPHRHPSSHRQSRRPHLPRKVCTPYAPLQLCRRHS